MTNRSERRPGAFRKIVTCVFVLLLLPMLFCGCGKEAKEDANHVVMSLGKRITSLDPALAADTTSQAVIGAFYDMPLQYRYRAGEYQLEPGLLARLPELSPDGKTYTCEIRKGLKFQNGPAFHGKPEEARAITSRDVIFSLLRLADTRLGSPGYWVIRGAVRGLDAFRKATEEARDGDYSPYDISCEGFTVIDDLHFQIHLEKPNPRFYYFLALPYCAVVSRTAVEYYGKDFARHPSGSGPFLLEKWEQDYVLEMVRNPEFRHETCPDAEDPALRERPLPLADRITCYLVKQPVSSWLMFLQGELDYFAVDADHFESVVNRENKLSPALTKRGITLIQAPELETSYIGFNFADPLLANNLDLRRAITLAFDRDLRILHAAGRFIPAYGPVPPGIPGYLTKQETAWPEKDLEKARRFMKKAGFPDGIDPATGRPLELTFDQAGSDTSYRQTAELLAEDLRQIGIQLKPEYSTRPRFIQKLSQGNMQLFRFSWTGDYPDTENFLQLFYSPNIGISNRVSYQDKTFDDMYRKILPMAQSEERNKIYRDMAKYITEQCPWIFEAHTVSFVLTHQWLKNYVPHALAFARWKYLSADSKAREEARRKFRPLEMKELR
ncbi:MAG: hypothetical protein J5944_07840 [Lentisphaeria bacterium]|nr:hypothetical protein [Lentisphaeria bacterium]